MKHTAWLLLALLAACSPSRSEQEAIDALNATPVLYTLETTAEVCVEAGDAPGSLRSLFGKRNIIVPVEAHIKVGYDLSRIENLRVADGKAYITLPDPQIEIEGTRILSDEIVSDVSGMRDPFRAEEESALAARGLARIQASLDKFNLIAPAEAEAQRAVRDLLRPMGLTPVFGQSKAYTEDDLRRLVID